MNTKLVIDTNLRVLQFSCQNFLMYCMTVSRHQELKPIFPSKLYNFLSTIDTFERILKIRDREKERKDAWAFLSYCGKLAVMAEDLMR